MFNLIKLELKKLKIQNNIKGIIIANISLLALMSTLLLANKFDDPIEVMSFPTFIVIIDTMVRATFIIYSSVLLGRLTVGEYKNKTINVMFMYPISRKKLFVAKLIIVVVFAFINMLFSNALLILVSVCFDNFIDVIPESLTLGVFLTSYLKIIINAALASLMVLITLYFGMKKKSVSATIVSGIIITCLVCQSTGDFSVGSILAITIPVALIGILVSVFTLRKIEEADVL